MDIAAQKWVAVGHLVEDKRDDVPDVCSCDPRDFGQGGGRLKQPTYDEQCARARAIAQVPAMVKAIRDAFALFDRHVTALDDGASNALGQIENQFSVILAAIDGEAAS